MPLSRTLSLLSVCECECGCECVRLCDVVRVVPSTVRTLESLSFCVSVWSYTMAVVVRLDSSSRTHGDSAHHCCRLGTGTSLWAETARERER
jgi:hypothetical protein